MNDFLTLYGLKFNPFRPDVPSDALYLMPHVDTFLRRVELTVGDGGFILVTGDPGTGKSVAMRLLADRLRGRRDVVTASIDHPQSRLGDFYRELGDLFSIPLSMHNRWAGFKALRQRWSDHIATTLARPVLIIDEAQEMQTVVLNELRVLTSKEFDSRSLLCVIFAGDQRLISKLREPDLAPLHSRIRRRLELGPAAHEHMRACLDHLLDAAGNSALMTESLKAAVVDHAAGNFRVMMNIADELLTAAAERELRQLDERLFFDVFGEEQKPKKAQRR
jgi:general secretion pathway protein A